MNKKEISEIVNIVLLTLEKRDMRRNQKSLDDDWDRFKESIKVKTKAKQKIKLKAKVKVKIPKIGMIVSHRIFAGSRYHLGCYRPLYGNIGCGCKDEERFNEKIVDIKGNKVKTTKLCGWSVQNPEHWEPFKNYDIV